MDAILCQKNINPVSKQSNPIFYTPFAFNAIVLEQFLILMTSLYLSYQFNNYTIYTTIIIAYIFHVFGHLIQTIVIRKYVPGLLTGILTSLFTLCNIKNEFPIILYGYSLFTLLVYRFKSCSIIYDS